MAQFSQINRARLAAGLPIDPKHEINETKKTADSAVIEEASAAPMNDYCVVGNAGPDSTLRDVLHCTNTRGLTLLIKGADKDFLAAMTIYHSKDEAAASAEAKKRIKAAKATPVMESAEEPILVEAQCPQCKKIQDQDPDYAAASKLNSQAQRLMRSKPEMGRAQMNAAQMHMNKFKQKKSDLKCNNCKNGINPDESVLPESQEVVSEYVIGRKGTEFDSWDKDELAAVNTSFVDGSMDDDTWVDNARKTDKNESPTQMKALGDLGNATDDQGYDHDKKVIVPTSIKKLLKDEIADARREAEKVNYSQRVDGEFYSDLAFAFEDILRHLEGGTVYDIKQAQIFMTSLMGPMLHKIPAEVVNFIARGGEPGSLRSYMNKVDVKV